MIANLLRQGALVVGTFVVAALLFTQIPAALETGYAQETDAPTGAVTTDLTDIYEQVSPSVVAINVFAGANDNNPFGGGGSGSGFVIDMQGHIVTNNHVVGDAQEIEVSFFDGTLARAEIVGLDPDADLAVIKVNVAQETLAPLPFGNSDALEVGETVVAIGSPFGQRWTLTSGIVSALGRTISGESNFSIGGVIQTDAAINPGNSGGPLINLNGEVIGVNTQMLSGGSRGSVGIGFAVPSNLTQRVSNELISNGFIEYSYIGIAGSDVTLDLIENLGLASNQRGVVVADVTSGSPAERGGLVSGAETDIITAVNGQQINGMADLISFLAQNTRPGDTITVSVLRNGQQPLDLNVNLIPRP